MFVARDPEPRSVKRRRADAAQHLIEISAPSCKGFAFTLLGAARSDFIRAALPGNIRLCDFVIPLKGAGMLGIIFLFAIPQVVATTVISQAAPEASSERK